MSALPVRPPQRRPQHQVGRSAGFSLLELLVVVGVIMLVAAVALPQIVGYVKLYRIRNAARQAADQLQNARVKAVMKNVNLGVVWAIRQDGRASTWVIEDDIQPQTGTAYTTIASENFATLLADRVQSPGWVELPGNVVFVNPNTCPGGAAAGSSWGVRFGRLGTACGVAGTAGTDPCPVPPSAPTTAMTYVSQPADTSSGAAVIVCLRDPETSITRSVSVTLGGRVLIQ